VDLSLARREAGATLEQLADHVGVSVSELSEWERTGKIPRARAARVKWGLWAVRRDAVLAKSGLAECEALAELAATSRPSDAEVITDHLDTCATCIARDEYIKHHVGPMPRMDSGLLLWLFSRDWGTGWKRSATMGALFILAMGGVGVVLLLSRAVVERDPTYLLMALGLFVLLVFSGGMGGVVHHLTAPLRDSGRAGSYLSGILTVYGYLGAVYASIGLVALVAGWEVLGEDMRGLVATRAGWVITLVMGALFGLVLGRPDRD